MPKTMTRIPDVLTAAANVYSLLLENDNVRVLEMRLKPGGSVPMHDHPHAHVIYVQNDAKFKLGFPDGKSTVLDLVAGKALWLEAGAHQTDNVGTTEGKLILVELKR